MSTETTDLLNAGEIVEALGRAWTLSHVGPAIRAGFSAWLKGRARAALSEDRRQGILEGDDYKEALSALTESLAAGSYNWGSPLDPDGMGSAVRTALNQTEGKVKLVHLLLAPTHGDLVPERVLALLADNPDGFAEAVRACLGVGRPADPNAPKPGSQDPA